MNDSMPNHVVKLVLLALKNTGKAISNSKIAVLGTAYKCDVDDSRCSPSEPVITELIRLGGEIMVYDPYCNTTYGAKKGGSIEETIENADCLVVMTDHAEFKKLCPSKIKSLMKAKPAFVDGKRIVSPDEMANLGFLYIGLGLGNSSDSVLGLEEANSLEHCTKNTQNVRYRRATD
jgi:UDP-N-acetyl-D-mannosaminuronic acid dehydrogenase